MADSQATTAAAELEGIVLEEPHTAESKTDAHPAAPTESETKSAENGTSGPLAAISAAGGAGAASADDAVALFHAKPYLNIWCGTWNVGEWFCACVWRACGASTVTSVFLQAMHSRLMICARGYHCMERDLT